MRQHRRHVLTGLGIGRDAAVPVHRARPGVVGGQGQVDPAELSEQILEQTGRTVDGLRREICSRCPLRKKW